MADEQNSVSEEVTESGEAGVETAGDAGAEAVDALSGLDAAAAAGSESSIWELIPAG